jgi:class III cytochrome C family protein
MRLKLTIIALYGLALLLPLAVSVRSFARSEPIGPAQNQGQRIDIRFDKDGRRGLVLFDHKKHEALVTPDARFPHPTPEGVACIGCHHTTKDVTNLSQFQKCTDCHKEEGNPLNPDDAEGFDLNSRDAFHRLCISCHRTQSATFNNERFQQVRFDKCGECHILERKGEAGPVAERKDDHGPAADTPDGLLAPKVRLSSSEIFKVPVPGPLGYAGSSGITNGEQTTGDAVPVPDRWRLSQPQDPRFKKGQWYNPYNQNILKGDYPVWKQHNFMILTLESETLTNVRRIPVPSNVNTQRPDSEEFFGRGGQVFFRQNFIASIEFFHGDTSFKPIDYRFRFTPNFNINLLNTQENSLVNINPAFGANRLDGYIGFQELFGEYRLGDTTKIFPFLRGSGNEKGKSPFFDTTFIRAGIQQFQTDFRGFIFNDFNLGARLFGQARNNRYNFNAAYFYLLEKDTNSELNTRVNLGEWRDQALFIANVYRQDTIWKGYTTQFSFHFNNDKPSTHFDENDFPVRPALIGSARPHGIKSYYIGWAGDGHINRLNINHAFYQVLGHDTDNPIAGRRTDINARMAAAELSVDRDWIRFKGSLFFASGDDDPFDDTARGFDSIVDLVEFAGGPNSFWNSNGIPFTNTGVLLTTPGSLLPNLRSSKFEGQSNFVNPGIFVYNVGSELEITPKLRGILNLNYSHFHHTQTLEEMLFQPGIRKDIGIDYGVGFLYRPHLNENIIVAGGFSSLLPGTGFKDIFSSNCLNPEPGNLCGFKTKTLYSAYVKLKFTY